MALKGFGHNPLGIEFRRGEFAMHDAFEAVQVPVIAAMSLLVLLFASLLLFVYRNQGRIQALEDEIYDRAASAYRVAYGDATEVPGTVYEIYDEMRTEFMRIQRIDDRGTDTPPVRSAIEVWVRLQEAIASIGREPRGEIAQRPGFQRGLWPHREEDPFMWKPQDRELLELEWTISKIEIRASRVELRGRAVKIDGLSKLRNALEAMTDLFVLDATGTKARVELRLTGVGDPNVVDSRGRRRDHRGEWVLSATLQPPRPARPASRTTSVSTAN